jgi:hypothetical protein
LLLRISPAEFERVCRTPGRIDPAQFHDEKGSDMSRDEAKEARSMIRTLLKWLAVSVAVAAVVSLVLATATRNAASTTPAAPALANDRAAALSERVANQPRSPAMEGNPDSPAIRGSGDPHFNAPETFEAYSGDFTGGEPIPAEMLKNLEHAKGLLFDEKSK